jgi:hypothetical protein
MGFSSHLKSNNPFRHHSSKNNDDDDVPPPPGPPPSHGGSAGSGPAQGGGDYAPPPGPPPSYSHQQQQSGARDDYAPPPGPPPDKKGDYQQQPQHNWQEAVPDTSGFPPPPDIFSGWDQSPASNATEDQADAGEAWCRRYPLAPPLDLSRPENSGLRGGPGVVVPRLLTPPAGLFAHGSLAQSQASGSWTLRTDRRSGDCCVIGYPHAYLVQRDSPLATGRPATVYFECYVRELARDAGLAVGFTALPYPLFR